MDAKCTAMLQLSGMGKTVKQLVTYFHPSHYDLQLDLDKNKMSLNGEVTITGNKVGRPTKRLTFHQKDLEITEARIIKHDRHGEKTIEPLRLVHHKSYDEIRIHVDELLYPGKYTVTLFFRGAITVPMNGVYPCNFTHNGKKKQLLATQFESHHAREVFPCIDEPAAKATFTLTTKTAAGAGETVISNTPIASQSTVDDKLLTTFEKTPVMSTYLLAFVVGELDFKEIKTNTGVTIRTYATPDNVAYVDFSLEVAKACLEFYDEYFGIPYPLEKCDMVALPDFASGAMENWGCITYREQTLLVDPEHSTLSTKQYVAMVIAHELAHQWFGNLVTMKWWTDLWLNEGFASWIEYLAVDAQFPDWNMWTQFIATEQQQALRLDTLIHTHPVEVPVNHPDEIRTIFDAISYSKGASVIHMLHDYLGAEDFKAGLRHYLTRHAYGNTETNDLWRALEEASGKPVRSFMQDWTGQSGFPLIKAEVDDTNVTLTQKRFTTDPAVSLSSNLTWPVPLLIDELDSPQLLETKNVTLKYSADNPLKLNGSQSGFYRTTYNASHMERLGQFIKKGRLPALDRIGIVSDTLESAKYGYSDTVEAVAFLDYYADENDYAVWEVISSWLGSLKLVMNDEELRDDIKPFVRSLIAKQLDRLGWEQKTDDTYFDKLLRPIIISMAAGADEPWIVDKCLTLFDAIHDTDEVRADLRSTAPVKEVKRGLVHPDLRGAVFGTVARRRNDQETFDKLVHLHNTSHLSEEKTTLAAALTAFQKPELIDQSLQMIASSDVRLQDTSYWIAYSFLNRHAKEQTWEWMKANWQWLENNLGSDLSFYRMPLYAARAFSTEAFTEEFQAFFKPRLKPGLERPYKQGLEMLAWQARWRTASLKTIKQYFTAKYHQSAE